MIISRKRWVIILLLCVGLASGAVFIRGYLQENALHALPYGFKRFSLSDPVPLCGRWKEHMPSKRDPAAYRLYIEARKVWRSKIGWQLTLTETTRILTDVRKASELGDWGARALLAHFYLYGLGVLESNHVLDAAPDKAVEIARMASAAGQPWGVFDLGVAYEHGYGGAVQDRDLAWAYFLRAAELGSPDAQMTLASVYGSAGRFADEETMLKCAYLQGHGPAAYDLGIKAEVEKRYMDAIKLHQEGVKFGSKESAASLELLFTDGHGPGATAEEKAELRRIGIRADSDRKSRYDKIYNALEINPDLRLKRLDEVLPLPPDALPSWVDVNHAIEPETGGAPSY